jgi:hypothetical protein
MARVGGPSHDRGLLREEFEVKRTTTGLRVRRRRIACGALMAVLCFLWVQDTRAHDGPLERLAGGPERVEASGQD